MYPLLTLFIVMSLVAGGCVLPEEKAPSSPISPTTSFSTSTSSNTPSRECSAPPTEDESGAQVFPIADDYRSLPHLGQIFTALDCGDTERIQHVQGFKDGRYVMGVVLRWSGDIPTDKQKQLSLLGFKQGTANEWRMDNPLTLDQMKQLKDIVDEAKTENVSVTEDCVLCG